MQRLCFIWEETAQTLYKYSCLKIKRWKGSGELNDTMAECARGFLKCHLVNQSPFVCTCGGYASTTQKKTNKKKNHPENFRPNFALVLCSHSSKMNDLRLWANERFGLKHLSLGYSRWKRLLGFITVSCFKVCDIKFEITKFLSATKQTRLLFQPWRALHFTTTSLLYVYIVIFF